MYKQLYARYKQKYLDGGGVDLRNIHRLTLIEKKGKINAYYEKEDSSLGLIEYAESIDFFRDRNGDIRFKLSLTNKDKLKNHFLAIEYFKIDYIGYQDEIIKKHKELKKEVTLLGVRKEEVTLSDLKFKMYKVDSISSEKNQLIKFIGNCDADQCVKIVNQDYVDSLYQSLKIMVPINDLKNLARKIETNKDLNGKQYVVSVDMDDLSLRRTK